MKLCVSLAFQAPTSRLQPSLSVLQANFSKFTKYILCGVDLSRAELNRLLRLRSKGTKLEEVRIQALQHPPLVSTSFPAPQLLILEAQLLDLVMRKPFKCRTLGQVAAAQVGRPSISPTVQALLPSQPEPAATGGYSKETVWAALHAAHAALRRRAPEPHRGTKRPRSTLLLLDDDDEDDSSDEEGSAEVGAGSQVGAAGGTGGDSTADQHPAQRQRADSLDLHGEGLAGDQLFSRHDFEFTSELAACLLGAQSAFG